MRDLSRLLCLVGNDDGSLSTLINCTSVRWVFNFHNFCLKLIGLLPHCVQLLSIIDDCPLYKKFCKFVKKQPRIVE